MSNEFAIATVTAALKETIETVIKQAVGEASVHVGRPDSKMAEENKPQTGLFLYQVRPNAAVRNQCQPIRNGNGRLMATPYAALDLHYLISFYGDGDKYEPELMAAEVVRTLEATPVLSVAFIKKTIQKNLPALKDSDLHKAGETVRATPLAMDLEELSKLWSIFFQVPYALSLPYRCSYVVVEAEEQGGPALPVISPTISPLPMTKVAIEAVEAEAGATAPIVWGEKLRIRGHGLAKPGVVIRVGQRNVNLTEPEIRPEEIVFQLVAAKLGGELPAGVHGVQAVDPPPAGVPPHLVRTTDLLPFALRPALALAGNAVDGVAKTIKVSFVPKVIKGQAVRLLLEELVNKDAKNYVLTPNPIADGNFPATELVFKYKDIKAATYLVTAQVDGVYSAPEIQTDPNQPDYGQIKGPKAVIP